jgi:hypothetical protein
MIPAVDFAALRRRGDLRSVKVAVLDGGVSPEAAPAGRLEGVWYKVGFEDGRVRALPQDRLAPPGSSHGDQMAAAVWQAAPNARVVDLRVLDAAGQAHPEWLRAGLDALLSRDDIDVVSMSLALQLDDEPILRALCEQLVYQGKVIVAAAHNRYAFGRFTTGRSRIEDIGVPANFAACLAVECCEGASAAPLFRNGGRPPLDFAVPRRWTAVEGLAVGDNSTATAVVAGLAAMVSGSAEGLSPWAIRAILEASAVPMPGPAAPYRFAREAIVTRDERGSLVPPPPLPGAALLVEFSETNDQSATVWRLLPGMPYVTAAEGRSTAALPLGPKATADLTAHAQAVTRHVPVIFRRPIEERGVWHLRAVGRLGVARQDDQSDPGFALGLFLAQVSRFLDRPIPHDLVALAGLEDARCLREARKGALKAQLLALTQSAPWVRRVLVAQADEADARGHCERLGLGLEIVGVEGVAEALERAFPRTELDAALRTQAPAEAKAHAEHLFDLAVDGAPIGDWRCVDETARVLGENPGLDELSRELLTFARRVAERHWGKRGVAVPALSPRAIANIHPRQRHRVRIQTLQSALDAGSPELPAMVDELLPEVPRWTGAERGERKLAGVLGRALAGLRRYEESAAVLRLAADWWWSDPRETAQASHPLCEYVRVRAIAGHFDPEDASTARLVTLLREAPDRRARVFPQLALLRAIVLTQQLPAASPGLAGEDLEALPDEGEQQAAFLRWIARWHFGAKRLAQAEAMRGRLFAKYPDSGAATLARIDVALEQSSDPAAWVERFESEGHQACGWLLKGADSVQEKARRLSREYVY